MWHVHPTQSSNLSTEAEQCYFTVDVSDNVLLFVMCIQLQRTVGVRPRKTDIQICDLQFLQHPCEWSSSRHNAARHDMTREFGVFSMESGSFCVHVWLSALHANLPLSFGKPFSTWAGGTVHDGYAFLPSLGYPDNTKRAGPGSGGAKHLSFVFLYNSQYFAALFITTFSGSGYSLK